MTSEHFSGCRNYSTEANTSKKSDYDEKRKKFKELEEQYQKMLCIENLTTEERRIHVLHAEAVAKGHFTYDDPWLNEKCIYEHSSVVDEKQKAKARFNSSFWVYDKEEEDDVAEFDEQHVVTYGRGPYPRKYAENAPQNMIKIPVKPRSF
ncbi:30S ribosomal protein S5 [Frankliniella fusca]|uniref:30S ribosomal protein S5 n=1 Tax=Frankliniella fusca TaxID=407009 RepID=A0AAE1LJD8_9NEOP|nr:30S ribosomal protein S5 [Frankliniella fusca]